MLSNLSHTDNSDLQKKCSHCSRSNPVPARFCGGCGRSMRFSGPTMAPGYSSAAAISESSPSPNTHEHQNPACRIRKPFSLRRLLIRNRAITATILLFTLFALSGFLYSSQPAQNNENVAVWFDFRAFLARKFDMPHHELDSIFFQLFSENPDEKSTIDVDRATTIEGFLRQSFGQPQLSLFPNPFFEAPAGSDSTRLNEDGHYKDVSPTSPVYMAIEPLSRLGIRCGNQQNCIRPWEKMTWPEWQKTVSDLFKTLTLDSAFIVELCSGRAGVMTNQDIRNFLEHLREKLMIKSTEPLIFGREKFFPSRIEALGALSAVIKELNSAS